MLALEGDKWDLERQEALKKMEVKIPHDLLFCNQYFSLSGSHVANSYLINFIAILHIIVLKQICILNFDNDDNDFF